MLPWKIFHAEHTMGSFQPASLGAAGWALRRGRRHSCPLPPQRSVPGVFPSPIPTTIGTTRRDGRAEKVLCLKEPIESPYTLVQLEDQLLELEDDTSPPQTPLQNTGIRSEKAHSASKPGENEEKLWWNHLNRCSRFVSNRRRYISSQIDHFFFFFWGFWCEFYHPATA